MSLNHVMFGKIVAIAAMAVCSFGQPMTFSSGSTGADGPLNYTTPGTYYFNPTALNINPSGNNIFNFTTINIASGVTLIFTSQILTGPMYWLASGDVTISGTLSSGGAAGKYPSNNAIDRIPSAAGAGGFGGGVGGGGSLTPSPGNGPGGGAAATTTTPAGNGMFTGNQYLVPLVGGSGGGGSFNMGDVSGCGGGGGGGAILIASSTTITLNSSAITIDVSGGSSGSGGCSLGSGSGGAIRLVANTVNVSGSGPGLNATGPNGNDGRIRIEAFSGNFANYFYSPRATFSVPFALALPATTPAVIKVTSINGIPINANPFTFPDAQINTTGPVTVNVQAQYIPVGTIPKIYVFGESGPDQTITCSALAGTLQQSTCSASITFVTGGSRGFVKATW